jgi:uncharacterized membrane protein YjjP (DUF1212 family)
MSKEPEIYIQHEVRIRVLEKIAEDTKEILRHMDTKMDSQFKWIIASIVGLFCGTFMPLFGGIILHMAKLI